jgi:hypothetical protein
LVKDKSVAVFSGLMEDNLIQPMSVWITHDCVTKSGHLGAHWKSPSGEVDLARMEMSLGSQAPKQFQWVLQSNAIDALKRSLVDPSEMPILNEALGNYSNPNPERCSPVKETLNICLCFRLRAEGDRQCRNGCFGDVSSDCVCRKSEAVFRLLFHEVASRSFARKKLHQAEESTLRLIAKVQHQQRS